MTMTEFINREVKRLRQEGREPRYIIVGGAWAARLREEMYAPYQNNMRYRGWIERESGVWENVETGAKRYKFHINGKVILGLKVRIVQGNIFEVIGERKI